ncbi:MAG: N-acetylmuramoyl-L-alanine amidase [Lachnospiraceae bacterium]|nr:N-acetylmuramoyl-L-alanine amidase [Lachnospiraceae bacterium]
MASVILDAGHGGFDNGAAFEGRLEKNDNLNLALAVGNILQNNGIDVMYTRTEDVYQSPTQKARIANESGADYFVSIHRNSSAEPNTYSGVQTLVYEDEGAPAIFAENINNELAKTGFTNIGTEVRKNLAVLRRTTMPAVLVEAGFINTDKDNQIFDLKFPEVAQAIANGIIQSIRDIEGGIEATQECKEQYSIETGIFRHLTNAKELARLMQEEGYDCYIDERKPYYVVCYGAFSTMQETELAEKKLYQAGYETRIIPHSH